MIHIRYRPRWLRRICTEVTPKDRPRSGVEISQDKHSQPSVRACGSGLKSQIAQLFTASPLFKSLKLLNEDGAQPLATLLGVCPFLPNESQPIRASAVRARAST